MYFSKFTGLAFVVILCTIVQCHQININLKQFEIHGHRGCRGLLPENTLAGFAQAIKLGCSFIELDIVMNKDHNLIISHEGYFHPQICLKPDGSPILENEKIHLYDLDYQTIKTYDCGSKLHPSFPDQVAHKSYKPSCQELLNYLNENGLFVNFNLELKIEYDPYNDPFFSLELFADKLIEFIEKNNLKDKVIIQSFNYEILQIIHKKASGLTIGLLNDSLKTSTQCIRKLGFSPHYYNPHYSLVSAILVNKLHKQNIKVVPWTVNKMDDMKSLINMGVDGIITDYPNRLVSLIAQMLE